MSAVGTAKLRLALALHAAGLTHRLLHLRRRTPVVLRYHRVYPDGATPFYELGVSRRLFEGQLDFLARHCAVVPLATVYAGLFEGAPLPDRAVAITFDDGYRDNLTEATPALAARNMPATLFVSADNLEHQRAFWWDRLAHAVATAPPGPHTIDLGQGPGPAPLDGLPSRRALFDRVREAVKLMPAARFRAILDGLDAALRGPAAADDRSPEPLLSWDEVNQMRTRGWAIGSHTLDHPILSRLEPDELERQVVESKSRIESRVGTPVRFFSYPNGKRDDVSAAVRERVRAAGYDGAVSTIEARPSSASDPFFLERKGATVGTCAGSDGEFSEALFATELTGLFDLLLLKRIRDRAVY